MLLLWQLPPDEPATEVLRCSAQQSQVKKHLFLTFVQYADELASIGESGQNDIGIVSALELQLISVNPLILLHVKEASHQLDETIEEVFKNEYFRTSQLGRHDLGPWAHALLFTMPG